MSERQAKRRDRYRLERQQNRVRGVLGMTHRSDQWSGNRDITKLSREGVRKVLMDARLALQESERAEFFAWFEAVAKADPRGFGRAIALGPLGYILDREPLSIASEIDWARRWVALHSPLIDAFVTQMNLLDRAVWSDDQDAARSILSKIESELGTSLWFIESRIAIEQHFGGLSAQKAAFDQIRIEFPKGLPAYLGRYISIRNEPRSSLSRYNSDAAAQIDDTSLSTAAKAYLKYKLTDHFSGSRSDAASVLRIEQSQSVIDLYQATLGIFQRLIEAGQHAPIAAAMRATLDTWKTISDFRLEKLRLALGSATTTQLEQRDATATGWLLEGDLLESYKAARTSLSKHPTDLWALVELASIGVAGDRPMRSMGGLKSRVAEHMKNVLRRDQNFEHSAGELTKLARNFGGLPSGAALTSLISFLVASRTRPQLSAANCCLNLSLIGPEDQVAAAGLVVAPLAAPNIWTLWQTPEGTSWDNPLHKQLVACIRAMKPAVAHEDAPQIALQAGANTTHPILRGISSVLQIDRALAAGDYEAATEAIAREVSVAAHVRPVLPIIEALGKRDWSDLRNFRDKLSLSIGLELLWRQTGDDLTATHLRFAYEEYLAAQRVEFPHSLVDGAQGDPRLFYFLQHVCIPQIMDMSGTFANSRDLTDERIRICEALLKANPLDADQLQAEVDELRTGRLIKDGLNIVDRSRLHVDANALTRWARGRLREGFARYKALVAAGIGVSQDFEDILKAALRMSDQSPELFNIPTSEADTLLLEILLILKHEFLTNSDYGLNFYLSKRIRHGTLAGYLRGPVQKSRLITERVREGGPYQVNEHWIGQLSFVDDQAREFFIARTNAMSEQFDLMIHELKDVHLQIRSVTHPTGLFDIVIPAPVFHLLRGFAQQETDFNVFLSSCMSGYWALLERSLQTTRGLINTAYRERFAKLFDELQQGVRNLAVSDDGYREFSRCIREASGEVQNALTEIAEWFRRPEADDTSRTFTLDQILDISIESALKAHPSFKPAITKTVDPEFQGGASILLLVNDVVFIVFDNIYRRAVVGNSPEIAVECQFDDSAQVLQLVIRNPVGPNGRSKRIEAALGRIRNAIDCGAYQPLAATEEGSGMVKLAALVSRSRRSSIEFGFLETGEFETKVRLAVITDQAGRAVSPEGVTNAGPDN